MRIILMFKRYLYFIWNRYLRSDQVKTINGRIYSRKALRKAIKEYSENKIKYSEIRHQDNINIL